MLRSPGEWETGGHGVRLGGAGSAHSPRKAWKGEGACSLLQSCHGNCLMLFYEDLF